MKNSLREKRRFNLLRNSKVTKQYFFSVEGETEKWYLSQINSMSNIKCKVSFDIKVQIDPLKGFKTFYHGNKFDDGEINQLIDYESNDSIHVKRFIPCIDRMRSAEQLSQHAKFILGYSNFTFELWIILHRVSFNTSCLVRTQYLQPLNNAFNTHFENLDQFKKEKSFERVLNMLDINDVISATIRAKGIMQNNKAVGFKELEYKGFKYYTLIER
jgi:hypothetical protein